MRNFIKYAIILSLNIRKVTKCDSSEIVYVAKEICFSMVSPPFGDLNTLIPISYLYIYI